MWWTAFQIAEAVFAVIGLAIVIILLVMMKKEHCKGLSFEHKKEVLLILKNRENCACDHRHHKFKMRWICHVCETMKEESLCKDGMWRIENGKIVPDLVSFSKVPDRYGDD